MFDHPYAELPRAALRIGAVLEATDFQPLTPGRYSAESELGKLSIAGNP